MYRETITSLVIRLYAPGGGVFPLISDKLKLTPHLGPNPLLRQNVRTVNKISPFPLLTMLKISY